MSYLVPAFSLREHLERQAAWSRDTFGPGPRTKGVIDHITKELAEIAADPTDLTEWIDVVILALDGAWRAGGTPEEIIATLVAKQAKNEARSWPDHRLASEDVAIEHERAKRIYVSGPMAGYPGHNYHAFNRAEDDLQTLGFDVLNPLHNKLPEGLDFADYLRADLKMVCDSDGVATLPGWESSRGACLEVEVAHRLGILTMPLERWLHQ